MPTMALITMSEGCEAASRIASLPARTWMPVPVRASASAFLKEGSPMAAVRGRSSRAWAARRFTFFCAVSASSGKESGP